MALRPKMTPILRAMERLYPLSLADKSWDNVGLLVDALPPYRQPAQKEEKQKEDVLLTIDLTLPVLEDALTSCSHLSTIITYHPVIFRGLKSIQRDQSDGKGHVLLRCLREGIAVYSPHTAVDAAEGGVNDWLSSAFAKHIDAISPIQKHTGESINGHTNAGMGRVATLKTHMRLQEAIAAVKLHLGLEHVRVARGTNDIKTVAFCAGSGGSVLSGAPEADLWVTGEMSHHELLNAVRRGTSVILAEHSNTERGYLPTMKQRLEKELASSHESDLYNIVVSKVDRDPIEIV